MKKLIAILLLGVLTYSLAGFVLMFEIMVSQVREDMQAQIEHDTSAEPLTALTYSNLTQVDFSEIEDGELTYKRERYDIVKQKKLNDGSIVFYCIDDKHETALISHLYDDIVNNLDNQPRKSNLRFYRFMVDWYVFSSVKYYTALLQRVQLHLMPAMQLSDAPFISLHAPPPKPG